MYKLSPKEEYKLKLLDASDQYGTFEGIQDFPLPDNETFEEHMKKAQIYVEHVESIGNSAFILTEDNEANVIHIAIFNKLPIHTPDSSFKRNAS